MVEPQSLEQVDITTESKDVEISEVAPTLAKYNPHDIFTFVQAYILSTGYINAGEEFSLELKPIGIDQEKSHILHIKVHDDPELIFIESAEIRILDTKGNICTEFINIIEEIYPLLEAAQRRKLVFKTVDGETVNAWQLLQYHRSKFDLHCLPGFIKRRKILT